MGAVLAHLGAPPPPPGTPGLWALADQSRLRELLSAAKLDVTALEVLDDETQYDSPAAWLATTARLAGPLRVLFSNLDEAGREAIAARVEDAATPYLQPDGSLRMPERMLVACARRPQAR